MAPLVPGYTGLASVGYRFVCKRGPVIDVGAGIVVLHFPSAHVESERTSASSEAFTRLYPGAKLNVGWAF